MSETKNIKKMKAVRLHAIGDLRCDEMEYLCRREKNF